MLRSDAHRRIESDSIIHEMDSINAVVVSKIERELDPYDLVSMVFLLYDVPDTALQRLVIYQRVSSDVMGGNMNLLYDWAHHAQSRTSWKSEFLEALCVCQLFKIIKKLGMDPNMVKKQYSSNNIHAAHYVNPMKKALYRMSENMTSDNLNRLQNTLKTYEIDTTDYKTCELILLDLMCKKFITVESYNVDRSPRYKFQIEPLARIVQNIPGLQNLVKDIRDIQNKFNGSQTNGNESSDRTNTTNLIDDKFEDCNDGRLGARDFKDVLESLSRIKIEDSNVNFKSDTKKLDDDYYALKNLEKVGVCYIINQEDFHPSKASIERNSQSTPLDKRVGSARDVEELCKTMTALNFEVISHKNLDHKKMLDHIENIIEYRVQPDDSMFMLCIMSHGVNEHVYAADSVEVKLDTIQKLLDVGLQNRQLEIPKITIIQACQVNKEKPESKLFADSPSAKLNSIAFYATAPELEAYRHKVMGSIFIQSLCHMIRKYAKREHLIDIFTKVTNQVAEICTELDKDQVPFCKQTLRTKLYLQLPE